MRSLSLITGLAIVIAASFAAYVVYTTFNDKVNEPVACTMDAKLCPDGSYVGRTGPNCEFAECPSNAVPEPAKTTIETRIDEGASALDVKVVPLEVLEDSRCPIDVQCIWAGRVRLRALLSSGLGEAPQVFEIAQPITTEAEIVTLIDVLPAPRAGVEIGSNEYRFVFEIAKREN